MNNCIFCKIIQGEVPAYKVYEDDKIFAFLDIHPINPGHILVIPKIHESDFYNLDSENYNALMDIVKKLSRKVHEQFDPKKVGLIVAGWDVPHAHVHIVPMHDYSDITSKPILEGTRTNPTSEDLEQVVQKLSVI
jgi:histidine triad (HIT) family protein